MGAVRAKFYARQRQNTSRRKEYEVKSFLGHNRFEQRQTGTATLKQKTRTKKGEKSSIG